MKFFAASEAAEGPLPGDVCRVRRLPGAYLQVVRVGHHFATGVAEVRLFSGVLPHVNPEVRSLGEGFLAEGAPVRLLARVDPHVQSQAVSAGELLVALEAFESLVSGVGLLHVPDEITVPDEAHGTDAAGLFIQALFRLQKGSIAVTLSEIRQIGAGILIPLILHFIVVQSHGYGADTW